MKNTKLLFIVNADWFFLSHRLPIAVEAMNLGYEVHIATKITNKMDTLIEKGLIVHPINLERSKVSVITLISEYLEIRKIIKSINPNIVHLVTIKPVLLGGIALRFLDVDAVVFAVSGLGFVFINKGIVASLRIKITKLLYRIALGHKNKQLIFQNIDDQNKITNFSKISLNEVNLIPGSGVDLEYFKPMSSNSQTPVILLGSRLLKDKGIREFVEASSIVKKNHLKVRFLVAGEPDFMNPASIEQSEIDKWKFEGNVEFMGHITDIRKLIIQSTVVVLPSYREGLPKILIEAAACGRAIITTDVPGCRDAIESNVTGLLVPVQNSRELARKICYLLDNPSKCKELGDAGRKRAEAIFDINKVVKRHINIYAGLLDL